MADETAQQSRESRNLPECDTALRAVPAAPAIASTVARAQCAKTPVQRQDRTTCAHFADHSRNRLAANCGPSKRNPVSVWRLRFADQILPASVPDASAAIRYRSAKLWRLPDRWVREIY